MCQHLLAPDKASDRDLVAALERKILKFGNPENMPLETRALYMAGLNEMARRANALAPTADG